MMKTMGAIQSVVAKLDGWNFDLENRPMMNVKADSADFPIVQFNEYWTGMIYTDMMARKVTSIELFFMKLAPMHNDGMSNETIREEIEDVVYQFIKEYNFMPATFVPCRRWSISAPPPRFDANEVSILLRFDCELVWACL